MMEAMKKAFETIATAKVATSAHEARGLGFLSDSDRITMNRERVLSDAKARALELVRAGYEPPVPRTDIPAPGESLLAALKMGVHLMRQGRLHHRLRSETGRQDRRSALRRQRHSGHSGQRAIHSRSRARGIQIALRREEDAGENSVHAENRKDTEELEFRRAMRLMRNSLST